jgi:centrosomal protein CEP350
MFYCSYSAAIYSCETEKQNHIWMVQKPLMKARLALPKDSASLSSIVCREIMVAFGYEKRAAKENLIVRWSPQKRRDRVDQILVRELHSEEKEWTDYSQDETIVKDSVAESLFELLITDTVDHVKQALVK